MSTTIDEAQRDETIADLVSRSGDGRRTFRVLVLLISGFAVLAMAIVMLRPLLWPMPLEQQASKIVLLPPDAKVAQVVPSRWEGDGKVIFSLPEPKGAGSRLKEVWTAAGHPLPASAIRHPGPWGVGIVAPMPAISGLPVASKNRLSYKMSYPPGEESVSLTYDPVRGRYIYERSSPH
ncbi:hypothetical protein [Fimbriimonas ginsengisoli]|nr:hypothetical protein [Fimbriimonas ginsengisoli]